jgi:hypothetical protein
MPPGYALGVLALAASDAGFIGLTKLDYGPIVLGAFLRVLAVVAFLDLVQRSRRFSGGVLVAATALGLFDKLLFVWFVNALIVAALVVFRRELLEGWRAHPRRFTSVAVALAGTVAFFSWFLIVPLLTDPGWNRFAMPFTERVIVLIRMAKRVMDGAAMAWILIDQETLRRSWTWIAVLVAGGAGLALVRHRRVGRPLAFFLVLLAITAIQLVLTQQARRVHHTFSLWPWHFFLIVLVLWGLQPDPGRGSWRHVVPAAVIALLVAGQLRSTASLVAAHRSEQGFAVQWDPAIYRLSGVLEREYRDAPLVVSTDWGLHTPLHALAAPSRRGRYRDTWRVFTGDDRSAPDIKRRWMERLIEPGTLALTYVEGRSTFAVTRREVFALATERNLAHRLLRTIANEAGVPLYEIHRFDRPADGGRSASGETVP